LDEIKTASIPTSLTSIPLASNYEQLLKDFFATAVTSGAVQTSIIYVWPAAYLHVAVPGEKVNGTWVTECVNLPMVGMWVEDAWVRIDQKMQQQVSIGGGGWSG
jgi:hypothetical protein